MAAIPWNAILTVAEAPAARFFLEALQHFLRWCSLVAWAITNSCRVPRPEFVSVGRVIKLMVHIIWPLACDPKQRKMWKVQTSKIMKIQKIKNRFLWFPSKLNNSVFEILQKWKSRFGGCSKNLLFYIFVYVRGLFKRIYDHLKILNISETIVEIAVDDFWPEKCRKTNEFGGRLIDIELENVAVVAARVVGGTSALQ